MDLHVLRQPRAAGFEHAGDTDPWCDRVVVPIEGRHRDEPWSTVAAFNMLARVIPELPSEPITPTLMAWSGWLPEDHLPDAGAFAPASSTWMGPGLTRLGAVCDRLAPKLEQAQLRLALVPHARHVLSDPPSIRSFFKDRPAGPIGLVLEPSALLTEPMLADAQDHLTRIYESLADLDALLGVILTNVEPIASALGELGPVPIHRGVIDPDLICAPARRLLPATTRLIVPEQGLPRQLGLIRPAGRSE